MKLFKRKGYEETTIRGMVEDGKVIGMELKELLFFRTKAELDAYCTMDRPNSGYTDTEKETQRKRFCSLYQVIEEAGLEDEYADWKEANI